MANTKEIQNRIKSIQDTMKITKAMYMMSSMKLRKAKQKLENTEAYYHGLQEQIKDILVHFPNMEHLYFDNRSKDRMEAIKKKAFVVITGDKGMAGAYNHNILKEAQKMVDESESYRLLVVGEIGRHFFMSQGYQIEANFTYSATNPSMHRARVITEHIFDLYNREEIDEVYVIGTEMVNSMRADVHVEQVMPLKTRDFIAQELIDEAKEDRINNDWYTIYPSPKKVLEKLAYNYVTGYMYGALVEGTASEENSRMMAMKSATDNAETMLSELPLSLTEYDRQLLHRKLQKLLVVQRHLVIKRRNKVK